MFAADPLLCRDKGRWSSTTKVAEMAAPPGTFFNSIPSLRIYRNTIMYSDPIHQYIIFWTESNGHRHQTCSSTLQTCSSIQIQDTVSRYKKLYLYLDIFFGEYLKSICIQILFLQSILKYLFKIQYLDTRYCILYLYLDTFFRKYLKVSF